MKVGPAEDWAVDDLGEERTVLRAKEIEQDGTDEGGSHPGAGCKGGRHQALHGDNVPHLSFCPCDRHLRN